MLNRLTTKFSKYCRTAQCIQSRRFCFFPSLETNDERSITKDLEESGPFQDLDEMNIDIDNLASGLDSIIDFRKEEIKKPSGKQHRDILVDVYSMVASNDIEGVIQNQSKLLQLKFSHYSRLMDLGSEKTFFAIFSHPEAKPEVKLVLLLNIENIQTIDCLIETVSSLFEADISKGIDEIQMLKEKIIRKDKSLLIKFEDFTGALSQRMIRDGLTTENRRFLLLELGSKHLNSHLNKSGIESEIFDGSYLKKGASIEDTKRIENNMNLKTATFILRNSSSKSIYLFVTSVDYISKHKNQELQEVVSHLVNSTRDEYWESLLTYDPEVHQTLNLEKKSVLYYVFLKVVRKPFFTKKMGENFISLLKTLTNHSGLKVKLMIKKALSRRVVIRLYIDSSRRHWERFSKRDSPIQDNS